MNTTIINECWFSFSVLWLNWNCGRDLCTDGFIFMNINNIDFVPCSNHKHGYLKAGPIGLCGTLKYCKHICIHCRRQAQSYVFYSPSTVFSVSSLPALTYLWVLYDMLEGTAAWKWGEIPYISAGMSKIRPKGWSWPDLGPFYTSIQTLF